MHQMLTDVLIFKLNDSHLFSNVDNPLSSSQKPNQEFLLPSVKTNTTRYFSIKMYVADT
jgi:hypothetical protein